MFIIRNYILKREQQTGKRGGGVLCWFYLDIFLLQHKEIGIGHRFNNLDRPLPIQIIYT